jgi:acetyl-CoA synthetase
MLDFPRADRCDTSEFETTIAAFEAAQRQTGARACVVASLPEGMPESVGHGLLEAGIAPMQGIASCLAAIVAAHQVGTAQSAVDEIQPLPRVSATAAGPVEQWDEEHAKSVLASYGLTVPRSVVATSADVVPVLARELGYPVVLKALSAEVAHKSEIAGVHVGLDSDASVARALENMFGLTDRFLVEQMIDGASLELIVGVRRDPRLGVAMTLGAGGVLVELIQDTVTVLLPVSADDIRAALARLRVWPMLNGFRGRGADLDGVVAAIEAIVAFVADHADHLVELEVNPLLVLPTGAVAVDALIRLAVT